MRAEWVVAATLLVLIGGRPAAAEDVLAGLPVDEYWRHRREFAEMMPKAMAGDPVAQDRIGAFYEYGFIEQDYRLAALWYRRAVKQGNADAEYNLARLYLGGLGVTADDHEGIALLRAAAAQEHVIAKRWLGNALLNGDYSLSVDDKAGWQLIHEAALAGNVRAQFLWGTHLQSSERRIWFERAARFGDPDALSNLANDSERVHEGTGDMIAAARAGSTFAMGLVACDALEAGHEDADRLEGLRWLGLAIDQGDPNAALEVLLLDRRHLINLGPIYRAFLHATIYDEEDRRDREDREIPYFVTAIFNLSPHQRDEVRQLQSDYVQRKITFADLHVLPSPAAASQDWAKSCQLLEYNK